MEVLLWLIVVAVVVFAVAVVGSALYLPVVAEYGCEASTVVQQLRCSLIT